MVLTLTGREYFLDYKLFLYFELRANCQRVYLGGSFVSNKEYKDDFDGCYDDFNIDYDLLDPIFDEDLDAIQNRFGGELRANPIFQGFLQTDRDGNSRGIVALDPRELLQ